MSINSVEEKDMSINSVEEKDMPSRTRWGRRGRSSYCSPCASSGRSFAPSEKMAEGHHRPVWRVTNMFTTT